MKRLYLNNLISSVDSKVQWERMQTDRPRIGILALSGLLVKLCNLIQLYNPLNSIALSVN